MNKTSLSLVAEYAEITKSISPQLDRMEEIKSELAKLLPQGRTTSDIGDVTLSENVSYPMSKSGLSQGQINRLMSKKVDPKKWASLYPDDYAAAKVISADKPFKVAVKIHQ